MTGKLFLSVAALLFASTLSPTETKAQPPHKQDDKGVKGGPEGRPGYPSPGHSGHHTGEAKDKKEQHPSKEAPGEEKIGEKADEERGAKPQPEEEK
jgi:hypothetical protein